MNHFLFFNIGLLAGIILGLIFSKLIHKQIKIGNLRLDQSDPDEPYLFLEITDRNGLESIKNNDQVILDVVVKNYVSQ